MPRRAILCVDDEVIILMSLVQELKTAFGDQFIYEQAMNAGTAMEIIDELIEEGTDLIMIVSDWLMPGIKGDEFLERACDKSPKIRAIMITGQADDEAVSRVERNKCVISVVQKPWSSDELIALIENYCGLNSRGN
jgi:DNA-binding NtrC family response regulator